MLIEGTLVDVEYEFAAKKGTTPEPTFCSSSDWADDDKFSRLDFLLANPLAWGAITKFERMVALR